MAERLELSVRRFGMAANPPKVRPIIRTREARVFCVALFMSINMYPRERNVNTLFQEKGEKV